MKTRTSCVSRVAHTGEVCYCSPICAPYHQDCRMRQVWVENSSLSQLWRMCDHMPAHGQTALFMYQKHTFDKPHDTCQTAYLQFLQTVADTGWGRLAQHIYILPKTRTKFGERGSNHLGHSSVWLLWHYRHQCIQKTTLECTFWLCLPLTTVGAPERVA